MPSQATIFERLTVTRIRVLALLAANRTIPEIASSVHCSYHGARSLVRDLKVLTGSESARDVGRWWQGNREAYLAFVRAAAMADSPVDGERFWQQTVS